MGGSVEAGKFVVRALWPPPIGANESAIRRWRMAVSITVMFMGISTAGVAAYLVGALAFLGLPAVAFAGDITEVRQAVVALQMQGNGRDLRDLKRDIRETRTLQCQAAKKQDASVLVFAGSTLDELRDSYFKVAGKEAYVPACEEVLIGAGL